ncbi:HAD family hydrolase [Sporolactobacillus sp. THM19-2]|uniref:HAD family hydrolase n=1 Tax=Sporolactobacillus sp. THM19-2 TaxID=2511171 RepID=UPI001F0D6401|nr:HAD family hydrolase [Sporolactobacillus sp. THM19-2]
MIHVYETVLTDLDGTVLTPVNTVNAELTACLKKIKARGVRIFAVTGRSYSEACNILPADFPVDGMVTANGMAVFAGGTNIYQNALPAELVSELLQRAEKKQLYYQLHPVSGGRAALLCDRPCFKRLIRGERPESVHINEWLSRKDAVYRDMIWLDHLSPEDRENMSKMYFFSRNVSVIRSWIEELETISRRIPFEHFSSSKNNVEVNNQGVSKASGIEILLKHFHLNPAEALAFGDGENDLPMFRVAGHSVAMKNAPEHVKRHADEVTDRSNAENGLCKYLEKTFS